MMPVLFSLILFAMGATLAVHAGEPSWPDASNPVAGMGVCIPFTEAKPGELEMLSRAGFRWVRTDFGWESTEKKAGVYDFSAYDRLLNALDKFHLRALLILDYGNRLYDGGLSPHTDESRAAFARWAAASALHFQGRGVVWEIWNEPDGSFWKPHANAGDYAKLAIAASRAIRAAAPHEMVIGPALCDMELGFLEPAVSGGILNYWTGISIHPYFRFGPESYGAAYAKVRNLIDQRAPPGRKVEVLCGESGYSSAWWGIDEALEGKYLARLLLFDVWADVPMTIWYDWRDDGTDPSNDEHHFGIVRHDYHPGAADAYEPKPAYDAARTYSEQLAGLRFQSRLNLASGEDYVLRFKGAGAECFVAWTTAWWAHDATLDLPNGTYVITRYDAKKQTAIEVTNHTLKLHLDSGPQYIREKGGRDSDGITK